LYFDGPVSPFPGEDSGLPQLNLKTIDWTSGEALSFQFTPPGLKGVYYAVASPLFVGNKPVGAIVIAKKKAEISGVVNSLVRRLTIAFALALVVVGGLAWYVSRRLVKPLLGLSRAADAVAAGNYDVELHRRAAGEIGHLSERFEEMANRLMESETR